MIRRIAVGVLMMTSLGLHADAGQHTALSTVYTVDRKYKSMEGPVSVQELRLLPDAAAPELVWITGYRAVMVGPDGRSKVAQEFMCHSNLDFLGHPHLFQGIAGSVSPRLFTLSQGQFSIRFPKGFGIPVWSTQPLSLTTQVLNHNREHPNLSVRHKVTIDYLRNQDVRAPMRALFPSSAYGLVQLEGPPGEFGGVVPAAPADPSEPLHPSGCLIGGANASDHTYRDQFGRVFTGHWVVPPGREVRVTQVTKIMNLPFDTTLHYVAVHLHPFAESLELRDATDGRTIFKSRVKNSRGRIGLDRVDDFSSVAGVPVYKDHAYELISIYHNTTDVNQDSMAVMYLYLLDPTFRAPSEGSGA